MKDLICKTCGSSHFREEKNEYVCEYCGAIVVKAIRYPRKRIVLIIVLLVMIAVGVFMGYRLLYSVKQEIVGMKGTVQSDTSKNTGTQQYPQEEGPYADVVMKVEGKYGNKNKGNALQKSLVLYQKEEMNKAYYLALDEEGIYAYGFVTGAKTVMQAEEKALEICKKEKENRGIKEACIPYAVNNNISRLIINK